MKSRILVVFLFGIFPFFISGLNTRKIKEIISLNELDTLEIKKFNKDGKLIFQKIFPQYGISQILGYSYKGNKKKSYTWSHSNIGFIETEYEYDTINNKISEYTYEDRRYRINNLMDYHSIESLKSSDLYKKYMSNQNRRLESITYLQDTIPTKKIEYSEDGKVKETIHYIYENGKLVLEKRIASNNRLEEHVFEYDTNGNETKWSKIYNSNDTSVLLQKIYSNNRLIKEIFNTKGELNSETIFEYKEGLLKSKKEYNNKGELKIKSIYNYDENEKLVSIDESNDYIHIKRTIYYFYW